MCGRTNLLISHRVSTFANCDVLLRIEHGQVIQVTKPAPFLANEALQARGPKEPRCSQIEWRTGRSMFAKRRMRAASCFSRDFHDC